MGVIGEYMRDRSSGTRHAIVIDPADQTPEVAANRAMAAVNAGSRMILVGGPQIRIWTMCMLLSSQSKRLWN